MRRGPVPDSRFVLVGAYGPIESVLGDSTCSIWVVDANTDRRQVREFAYANRKAVLRNYAEHLLSTTHDGWRFYIHKLMAPYIAGEEKNG